MRIIGGRLGGLRFRGPPGRLTRPTPERVREGLASALEARGVIKNARVLDLFAGTGALSFEAISRGALRAVLVEKDRRVVSAIAEIASSIGVQQNVAILCMDLTRDPAAATKGILRCHPDPFDLVFADPPYPVIDAVPPLLDELRIRGCLHSRSFVAIEHATGHVPTGLSGFALLAEYRYGDTTVALLGCKRQEKER